MNLEDLAKLGEPITKLIEEVSKGIGTIYRPKATRDQADAEAYASDVQALAKARSALIQHEADLAIAQRTQQRLYHQEIVRQDNIESITEKAISHLPEKVSDEPLDDDWRTRFFNKAKDISTEEMQEVWAKILAEEVAKPGSIGPRTLEVVSNLSKKEAELFQVACSLSTFSTDIWTITGQDAFDQFGLGFRDIIALRDAGLVHASGIKRYLVKPPVIGDFLMEIGNKLFKVRGKQLPLPEKIGFDTITFTSSGQELCRLIEFEYNNDYINWVKEGKEKQGFKLIPIVAQNVS